MATQSRLANAAAYSSQQQTARLSIDNIHFAYPNGHEVFRSFSLHAEAGEFVALLGPSGCGKTTLLNLLSGFQKPLSGRISIDHEPVRPEMPALGYVFQSPQLFPWLTALENVRFGLKMQSQLSAKAQLEKAMHYLALVGLSQAAEKLPYQLSGGMQQRVSLARALALEPAVLLMDEPFAALDAITRNHLNEETLRLWSELKQTVLFITHDIDEAVFLADRVVVLGVAPQGVHAEVEINLPRPRANIHTRQLPEFMAYRASLMNTISGVIHANAGVSSIYSLSGPTP